MKEKAAKGFRLLVLVACCVFLGGVASTKVYAEEHIETEYSVTEIVTATTTEIYENYKYIVSNGKITITGLANPNISSDINLAIPAEINGTPVTAIASGAFYGNLNIKSVVFEEGLTYIGYSAFNNCVNLTGSIDLPSTLNKIDDNYYKNNGAFQNTSITSVNIADGNEKLEIPQYTFFNCNALKSVILPDRISYIGSYAFNNCTNLDNVVFTKGAVTKVIDEWSFAGTAIKEINIPDTVIEIGTGAFFSCKSLTKLTLNEGITKIGYSAFLDCINLTGKIVIPSTVKEICSCWTDKDGAFENTNVTEVEFKDGGDNLIIGSRAFYNCRSLKKISLPGRLASINVYAFAYDSSLEVVTFAEGNVAFNIGEGAFQITGIKDLNLPNAVRIIGDNAFYGCKSLTSVTFSEGITEIGRGAFQDCINLTGKIVIPSTVTVIHDYFIEKRIGTFQNTAITEVEIIDGNSSITIGNSTFYNCNSLTKVVLPGRVTEIGSYAFANNANLVTVKLSSGNYKQVIKEAAFQQTGIIKMDIPSKVTVIERNAFYGCNSLITLTLNEGLTTIGRSAFGDCTKLTGELVIPSTVTEITGGNFEYDSVGAFEGTAITSVVVKDGNNGLSIGGHTFANCIDLRKVELSNRVTCIDSWTFFGDISLVWVKIKNGNYDLELSKYAFCNSPKLQVVTLPKRTVLIDEKCFKACPALTDVYYAGSEADYKSVYIKTTENNSYMKAAIHYNSEGPYEMPDTRYTGWKIIDGKYFWFEYDELQGLEGRGKEIYDPASDAWYWLDSIQGGAKAVSKDVYQESSGGKWVRYDINGHMIKGWDTNENGTYYFDLITGAMLKGVVYIDEKRYAFDEVTGVMLKNGFYNEDGGQFWYEDGVKQGTEGRGKEIYDPETDAWYWLDSIQGGAVAKGKDVYQESNGGKWVRYDNKGLMIKGWSRKSGIGKYYFDLITGAMTKGWRNIDGKDYYFDEITGILQ